MDYLELGRLYSPTILAGGKILRISLKKSLGSFEANILAKQTSKDLLNLDICAYGFNLSLDNLANFYEKRFGSKIFFSIILQVKMNLIATYCFVPHLQS